MADQRRQGALLLWGVLNYKPNADGKSRWFRESGHAAAAPPHFRILNC